MLNQSRRGLGELLKPATRTLTRMTLDGNSTMTEVEQEYDDTASYSETYDVAKAKRFVTAVRILLRRMYSQQNQNDTSLSSRIDLLRDELRDAQDFINKRDPDAASPQPRVTFADFAGFRGDTGVGFLGDTGGL